MTAIRHLGLDVHAETIACAVAELSGEVMDFGVIENSEHAVRKLIHKLRSKGEVCACYEAGPTGYGLHRLLVGLDVPCDVVAPSLIPRRPGDRVKTDRRDARMLARLYRAGELTPVWVPDVQHEALRDLVRAREAAVCDQLRARNRLTKFLLRHDCRPPEGVKRWTRTYWAWLSSLRFQQRAAELTFADYLHEVEHARLRIARLEEAIDEVIDEQSETTQRIVRDLQALRGVGKVSSVTLVAEVGRFSRFAHPAELMGYSGLVPREHSSGGRIRQGGITKTGNTHLRRILVEAAWSIQRRPGHRPPIRQTGGDISPPALEVARRAQERLHRRYWHLVNRGKDSRTAVVAVARELLGFIWDVAVHAEHGVVN